MALPLKEEIATVRKLPRNDAVLMGRAELLAPGDRELMQAVLGHGQRTASLARLLGVEPRTIRLRLERLGRRMNSRPFLDAARALSYLPAADAALARARYCEGLSQRELCERFGMSRHELRRRLDRLAAQIETLRRMRRAVRLLGVSVAGPGGAINPDGGR